MWGRVEAGEVIGPAGRDKGKSPEQDQGRDQLQVADAHLAVRWTVAYYVVLVAGLVGFWNFLKPLTASSRALIKL